MCKYFAIDEVHASVGKTDKETVNQNVQVQVMNYVNQLYITAHIMKYFARH